MKLNEYVEAIERKYKLDEDIDKSTKSIKRKKLNESIFVDDMFGALYQDGLESVIDVLNAELGLNLSYRDDWEAVHNICDIFGIKFDENGNILRESYKHSLKSKKLNEDRHSDRRVREYLSELLYGIKDSGLQELVRNIIFSYASSMDWNYVVDLIIKYMPECTLELKDLGIIDESYKINEDTTNSIPFRFVNTVEEKYGMTMEEFDKLANDIANEVVDEYPERYARVDISDIEANTNGLIAIDFFINNGDWKWDHGWFNDWMNEFAENHPEFKIKHVYSENIGESGRDVSDQIHRYYFTPTEEFLNNRKNDTIAIKESNFSPYDGWTEEDIELHKSIDWPSRNYFDYPVESDSFKGQAILYSTAFEGGKEYVPATFIKYIRSNPIFPPYYAPKDLDKTGFVGPMYDGNNHGNYQIHDRYETEEIYRALSWD